MKRSMPLVLLVFGIFFVISFLTNILGPLVPDIIKGFSLSLTLAGFLPFSLFVAYGVMSIPAAVLLDRFGQKPILIAAFALAFGGSFLFASSPTFSVALMSLFMTEDVGFSTRWATVAISLFTAGVTIFQALGGGSIRLDGIPIEELRRRLDQKREKFEGQAGRQMARPSSIEQMQKAAAAGTPNLSRRRYRLLCSATTSS